MKLDNLDSDEECPFFENCPLGDTDPTCERYYLDCPRFIDYMKEEEKRKIKNIFI